MIYFDNAATGGRKPDCVLTAVNSAIKVCANAGRSGHKLSLSCLSLVEDCRHTLCDFFDGYSYDRVVFTKNCSEGLNIALFGILKEGDHVILTCMEHNSVLRPLQFLKSRGVIDYDIIPTIGDKEDGKGKLDVKTLKSKIKPNTKLFCITSASNVNGAIPNLEKIRAVLPEKILLICDGAQGCGHLDIKMRATGIDLLSVAGHKGMQGIQGSGALLFSERVNPNPILFGGTGSMSLSLDAPDFYPDRLEAGTLSYPAIISLLEGTRYLTLRLAQTQSRLLMLTAYFLKGLISLREYQVYSIPNPCGIVAFQHKSLQSEYIADILSARYGIAVRGGLHCAPLMHEALGTVDGGLIRVSFSHFNSEREIDKLLTALQEIANV